MQAALQRDLQPIRQECDEDMGFDPAFVLMEDRADRQILFEVFERHRPLNHATFSCCMANFRRGAANSGQNPQPVAFHKRLTMSTARSPPRVWRCYPENGSARHG